MKVVLIGASGTVGSAVKKELLHDTTLIEVNHSSGQFQIDMASHASIEKLFQAVGAIDAVVVAAARGIQFKSVPDMHIDDYMSSMQQKLLGQIDIALSCLSVLNDGGSITLTTGCLNRDFIKQGSAASLINSAVDGFVRAASLEMPRGIRINAVSPALLEESAEKYAELFPGFEPVSSDKVGRAYRKSIYSIQTGQVYVVE